MNYARESKKGNIERTAKKLGCSRTRTFGLLKKYTGLIVLLVVLTVVANAFSVIVPKMIASAIDGYDAGSFVMSRLIIEFSVVALLIFVFTYLQNIVQVYASETGGARSPQRSRRLDLRTSRTPLLKARRRPSS